MSTATQIQSAAKRHARDAPLGVAAAAGLSLCISVLMCWPMLVTGDVFVFFDTQPYLSAGRQAIAALSPSGDNGSLVEAARDMGASPSFLRSLGYSTFLAGFVDLGGPLLVALVQGWIAIFVFFALVPAQAVRPAALLGVAALMLTTLPWFTVFMMPDLFAAVLIAYAAALWRGFDQMSGFHRLLLVGLATAAAFMHYGYPPLIAGLLGLVLLGRLVQRRLGLGVLIAALIPILGAPLGNYAASSVALETASAAPLRIPILLARSIEDGPAAWYLADACLAGEPLAICAAFDGDVPDDMTTFLWSEEGLESLTSAEVAAIRDEEGDILLAAFLRYPLAQTWSLGRNAVRQLYSVGLAKVDPQGSIGADPTPPSPLSERLVALFDGLVDWTTLAGATLCLILAAIRRCDRGEVVILVTGLCLNALIFGGLSAPDDRYQARVAWLLPAMAVVCLLRRPRDRQLDAAAQQRHI